MNNIVDSVHLREVAEKAALSVKEMLKEAFRSDMSLDFKRDLHDIVTVHDKNSEIKIVEQIFELHPDSQVIGEEGGVQGSGNIIWHIDPIDGTSNFARGIPLWCVSIAAEYDNKIVAAAILDPMAGDMFSADEYGAYLNGEVLKTSAYPQPEQATLVTSTLNAHEMQLLGVENATKVVETFVQHFQHNRSLGSGALNLAYVAAGWADATMGFETNTWDVAAGSFILEQTGGVFRAFTGGVEQDPAFKGKDYFGIGAGGNYPILEDTIRSYSEKRKGVEDGTIRS